MKQRDRIPQTLLEAVTYFADERAAWQCVVNRRWANGVACPLCGCVHVHLIESRLTWRCNGCKKQFSVKVGTIFEASPIPFSKWLPAMWLIANAKKGISSCELARALKVTQKTAWFMLHRIRLTFQNGSLEKLSGTVEGDETYVGGKEANKHFKKRENKGRGLVGKTAVDGILQRGGEVRAFVVENVKAATLHGIIRAHVTRGSKLFTDHNFAYRGLKWEYTREFVSHVEEYVRAEVQTNSLENFWGLFKRTVKETYVCPSPWQLFRYVDKQAFRYNTRKDSDSGRFVTVLSQVVGRRLTYAELTGKMCEA